MPVEFQDRETLRRNPVIDMREYGTHNQPAGTWSDNTSTTLCLLDSLSQKKKIDYEDIMQRFLSWMDEGEYTALGEVFDVGSTTRQALQRFKNGRQPLKCGGTSEQDNGNGSLMRILPKAIYFGLKKAQEYYEDEDEYIEDLKHFHRLFKKDFADLPEDEIKSSGYVVDTLEAALWCSLNTDNYKDCVLKAVNLGGDTDTVAAVAGGLAGMFYGVDAIPEEWLAKLARLDYIKELCKKFCGSLYHY